jgi:hypothetical protein
MPPVSFSLQHHSSLNISWLPLLRPLVYALFLINLLQSYPASAQTKTPEFPRGFVGYLKLQQGVVSDFKNTPDNYQIGFTINPEYTLLPGILRVGVKAGGIYTNHKWGIQGGPAVSLRLFDISAGVFGTVANVQLRAAHLWGSHQQKLVGGGIQAEIFQLFSLSFTGYRDYSNKQWWIQSAIGYNIIKPRKKNSDPFTQP